MEWKTLLAYMTGTVDQELLLRSQITGRVRLTDGKRTTLVALGQRLGKKALAEVISVVKPETPLAWRRKLIPRKFEGSTQCHYPGRPGIDQINEQLSVHFAREFEPGGMIALSGR